ncbi:MAG: SH3 domain-containing protein [Bacteroidetes bacterium]|nr:SH3 domain-containing protein [Bacteroidota bacterium]
MHIKKSLLINLGVTNPRAERHLPSLNTALKKHKVDTPLRVAHFLAQLLHESALFKYDEENLNYSAKGLLKVFGKYFSSLEIAHRYARMPEKIANIVYGNRMGNGDEASGEGYKYRGRGLIQLTGKNNYRKFSKWINEDVVSSPDLVASKYAVHSAVYYWVANDLNSLADIDDVKKVTKRINGGYNGLEHRIELLDKIKKSLRKDLPSPSLEKITHKVNVSKLNLRNKPRVAPSTLIGSLSEGTAVMKVADSNGWVKIRTVLNDQLVEGFVAGRFLHEIKQKRILTSLVKTPIDFNIPVVHLKEKRSDIKRLNDWGRAFPLGETNMPKRFGTSPETKSRKLIEIIKYLDCEKTSHKRYGPKTIDTYCNIYAYDYCYLAGVYIPRVWWKEQAIHDIKNRKRVSIEYDRTVEELSANMLNDWFGDYGVLFGWKRVINLEVLQAAANNGEVCLIIAKHKNSNSSGHIAAVVPEHDGYKATRKVTGEIAIPLQSQAGRNNYRFTTKSKWWQMNQFQNFSFWRYS